MRLKRPIILTLVGLTATLASSPVLAQLNESGTSTLADAFGTASGPEALTVNWSVVEVANIYTYSYTVNNPLGDVLLNPQTGQPTGTSEIVDFFAVTFDTTAPGAYLANSQNQPTGTFALNNGVDGLAWAFTAVPAGTNSPTFTFESDLPPVNGDASAQDANPPSPWSSFPDGQPVPVPGPVPDSASTVLLLGGTLLSFRIWPALRRLIRR